MAFSAICRRSVSSFASPASRFVQGQRNYHSALFTALNRHANLSAKLSPRTFVPSFNYSTSEESVPGGDQESKNTDRVGGIPDIIKFHYEDVLRQDLLLKLNPSNIAQVPRVSEIKVMPKASEEATTKTGKLAMEISCSQKFTPSQSGTGKKSGSNPFMVSSKDRGYVPDSVQPTSLRGQAMSNFLLRLLTVMSLSDSRVAIGENTIRIWMDKEFVESCPELEDHLEIFEQMRRGFNVTIVTTANSREETKLLWSGLVQKDEGETL